MRAQHPLLRRAGVQGEPVRLRHFHSTPPVAASTARRALPTAARRPYNRSHRDVRISVTSRAESSSTSRGPRRQPAAGRGQSGLHVPGTEPSEPHEPSRKALPHVPSRARLLADSARTPGQRAAEHAGAGTCRRRNIPAAAAHGRRSWRRDDSAGQPPGAHPACGAAAVHAGVGRQAPACACAQGCKTALDACAEHGRILGGSREEALDLARQGYVAGRLAGEDVLLTAHDRQDHRPGEDGPHERDGSDDRAL